MTETRNILLIGRTGSGKSTLGNVLINKEDDFKEVFEESDGSISATKGINEATVEIDLNRDGSEKIKYRIIDTIGIGDTKLTPQGVLTRLAEIGNRVKKEGLNHILFVTQGRFTKEEIEAYDLLSSIIFDQDVLKYTTIVRTNFPRFKKEEICANDRAKLRTENTDLAHILNRVNILYVDNPATLGLDEKDDADQIRINKGIRQTSRKRVLTYLGGCAGNYRPDNIDDLEERVREYKTNEQKLTDKMKELDKEREKQAEEFRKKISELKEEQAKELRENRVKFEDDIRKVKAEGDENLRKTKDEMEEKRKKDMADLENRNQQRMNDIQASHQRDKESILADAERTRKSIQDQMQQAQQETRRLCQELEAKGKSSGADVSALIAQVKLEGEQRQKDLKSSAETNQKRFEAELAVKKEADEREFKHRQEMDRMEQKRKDEEVNRRNEQQAFQLQKEKAGFFEKG